MTRYTYTIQDLWGAGEFQICQYANGRFSGTVGPRFESRDAAADFAKRKEIEVATNTEKA